MISIDAITEDYLKKIAVIDSLGPALGSHGNDEHDEYRCLLRNATRRLTVTLFVLYAIFIALIIGGPILLWWMTVHGSRSPYDGLAMSPSVILLWKAIRLNEQLRLAKENEWIMVSSMSPKERREYLAAGLRVRKRQDEKATFEAKGLASAKRARSPHPK